MAQPYIEELVGKYPARRSALLPVLAALQREHGNHLSPALLRQAARELGLTPSEAFGVATYYTLFNTKPVGRYHLQLDTGVPAYLAGALELLAYLERRLGIKAGETTACGRFTLSTVQDLASCGTCPVLQVNETYYENLTVAKLEQLLAALEQDRVPEPDTRAHWGSRCNVLLKNRGNPRAVELAAYRQQGGYRALEQALARTPAEIIDVVKEAGLRGRGGAGFPTAAKWGFVPRDAAGPVYLVCNADEGEPGTFKDRQIMQYDPHLLVEGIAIAAYAIGAPRAFIYIRGEFDAIARGLERAIAEAEQDGLLAHLELIVHRGAGSYICGEETALLESLEGKRGCPRMRPPFPAVKGLYGCPTIINNVETLACLPYIVEHGPAAFRQLGTPSSPGPRLYGVSGHVHCPGVFEFPSGIKLEQLLEAAGGVKGQLKAVIVGGLSVPLLTAAEAADLSLDPESCQRAGTMLGSAGLIVLNETVSIPELALRTIAFYAHESCGQCVPCWRGSHVLEALLARLVSRQGTRQDIATALELCRTIKGTTLCPAGEAFAAPLGAMLTKFRAEFEALAA